MPPTHPDGIEDVEDAQAVLQLPPFLFFHGAEHHLAEVLYVYYAAEHDDKGLDTPKVLPEGEYTRYGVKEIAGVFSSVDNVNVVCLVPMLSECR